MKTRVTPCSVVVSDASCSMTPDKINFCRRYLDKVASTFVTLGHDRCCVHCRPSEDIEATQTIEESQLSRPVKYQQSSTRQLAFGAGGESRSANGDSSKRLKDFYNNSTLSLIAKVLSFIVILVTVLMLLAITDYNLFDWLV